MSRWQQTRLQAEKAEPRTCPNEAGLWRGFYWLLLQLFAQVIKRNYFDILCFCIAHGSNASASGTEGNKSQHKHADALMSEYFRRFQHIPRKYYRMSLYYRRNSYYGHSALHLDDATTSPGGQEGASGIVYRCTRTGGCSLTQPQ